jgi:GntR family transcriptional regulator
MSYIFVNGAQLMQTEHMENLKQDKGERSESLMHVTLLGSGPLYKQVKQKIVHSLAEGEWKSGDMLPSEQKLAERYGVAVSTVRAAIGLLVAAKVLARKQGKGTFVPLHDERRSIYQFFHVVRNDGVKELPISELLLFKKGKADDDVADLLRLPRKAGIADVFKLRNCLRVSGVPVVVADITLPCSLFPGLDEKTIREGGKTLYAVYQSRFGINITRCVEHLRAIKADATTAGILSLPAGEPVLEVQRLAYTFNDVPVETRRSRVNTRDYYYLFDQGGTDG